MTYDKTWYMSIVSEGYGVVAHSHYIYITITIIHMFFTKKQWFSLFLV